MKTNSYKTVQHSAFSGLIGVAERDITPPAGIYSRNWGAARHDVADGVHYPMKLTCITFQSDPLAQPLVLIGADLGCIKTSTDELAFRSRLTAALDIDGARLMFCCSHTHAGPVLSREESGKPGGEYIDGYVKHLEKVTEEAAQEALQTASSAVLTWHYGKCSLATNRDMPDVHDKAFIVGFNPQQAADDTLLVGRITDMDNGIKGTIVNYACHPTTLAWDNHLISPDYVGAMRELVESSTKAPCLFLQGASGELSPAEQYVGNKAVAERNGRHLGYAVLSTLESMFAPGMKFSFDRIIESGARLGVWKQVPFNPSTHILSRKLEVPFRLKPLPSLEEIETQYRDTDDRVLKERLQRKISVRKAVGDGQVSFAPLWVWQLGDSFLIGQPNEAYSAFQTKLRKTFSPTAIAVMNLVNGGVAYLPPVDLYDKEIYQEWQTPFAAGSLEKLIESATEAVTELNNQHG